LVARQKLAVGYAGSFVLSPAALTRALYVTMKHEGPRKDTGLLGVSPWSFTFWF
jgi:hypothetical protein